MLKSILRKGANHQESGRKDYSRLSDLWVLGSKVPKQWESIFLLKWDHYFNMETWRMLGISAFRPAEFPNNHLPEWNMSMSNAFQIDQASSDIAHINHSPDEGQFCSPTQLNGTPIPPNSLTKHVLIWGCLILTTIHVLQPPFGALGGNIHSINTWSKGILVRVR